MVFFMLTKLVGRKLIVTAYFNAPISCAATEIDKLIVETF
jgi:hypothetical protein